MSINLSTKQRRYLAYSIPVLAVFAALLFGAIMLVLLGADPFKGYSEMFIGAFGSGDARSDQDHDQPGHEKTNSGGGQRGKVIQPLANHQPRATPDQTQKKDSGRDDPGCGGLAFYVGAQVGAPFYALSDTLSDAPFRLRVGGHQRSPSIAAIKFPTNASSPASLK